MRGSVLIIAAAMALSTAVSAQQSTQQKNNTHKKEQQSTKKSTAGKKDQAARTKETSSTVLHYTITVKGKVQNVGFRNAAKQKARSLDLRGEARNDKDGTVFIEVEGPKAKLDEFVDFCKEGSKEADVSTVQVQKSSQLKDYKEFDVDRVNKNSIPGQKKPEEGNPRE
jgi:acylphosphatase